MIKDFDLLWKIVVEEILAFSGASKEIVERDLRSIYQEKLKEKEKNEKS